MDASDMAQDLERVLVSEDEVAARPHLLDDAEACFGVEGAWHDPSLDAKDPTGDGPVGSFGSRGGGN